MDDAHMRSWPDPVPPIARVRAISADAYHERKPSNDSRQCECHARLGVQTTISQHDKKEVHTDRLDPSQRKPMPAIGDAAIVNFDIIARESCCRWSAEAGKISLTNIQELVEKYRERKAIPHNDMVQRVVLRRLPRLQVWHRLAGGVRPRWGGEKVGAPGRVPQGAG